MVQGPRSYISNARGSRDPAVGQGPSGFHLSDLSKRQPTHAFCHQSSLQIPLGQRAALLAAGLLKQGGLHGDCLQPGLITRRVKSGRIAALTFVRPESIERLSSPG